MRMHAVHNELPLWLKRVTGTQDVNASPGRHVCGEGDTFSYKGQRRGARDVLPLSRRCPSCMRQGNRSALAF